jgi:hypothetical protein
MLRRRPSNSSREVRVPWVSLIHCPQAEQCFCQSGNFSRIRQRTWPSEFPAYEFVDDATGQVVRAKVLSLAATAPDLGAEISTWAYPRHELVDDGALGRVLQLQPTFYNGRLQEIFAERGPSVKLQPPYYQTSIHLHGGSSGGPVFFGGHVFGIASSSYEDVADRLGVSPATLYRYLPAAKAANSPSP